MRSILVVLAALATTACNVCTLMACQAPLTLNIVDADGAPMTAFHGSVVDAQGRTVTFACPQIDTSGRYHCEGGSLHLFEMSTEQKQRPTLEVSIGAEGADAVTRQIKPAYTGSEINGEGCGMCFSSTATLTLD